MTIIKDLGLLGLASRLRGLADQLMSDGNLIYQGLGVDFQPRWFGIYYLLLVKGDMAVTDIADELNQSHPAIIKIITPMTKAGLIISKKNSNDGRKRMICLTEYGRSLESELEPIWHALQEAIGNMFSHLGIDIIPILNQIESEIERQPISTRCHQVYRERFLDRVTIVPFSNEHRENFRILNEEWLNEWFKVEARDKEILSSPEKIIQQGGQIFFALFQNTPIATVAVVKDAENRFEIAKMAVTSKYRKRGIGKVILTHALRYLKDRNIESVYLQTSPRLIAANKLYESIGFKRASSIQCGDYERATQVFSLDLT